MSDKKTSGLGRGLVRLSGIWRDSDKDFLRERALFSIYKRNSERPLYVIENTP